MPGCGFSQPSRNHGHSRRSHRSSHTSGGEGGNYSSSRSERHQAPGDEASYTGRSGSQHAGGSHYDGSEASGQQQVPLPQDFSQYGGFFPQAIHPLANPNRESGSRRQSGSHYGGTQRDEASYFSSRDSNSGQGSQFPQHNDQTALMQYRDAEAGSRHGDSDGPESYYGDGNRSDGSVEEISRQPSRRHRRSASRSGRWDAEYRPGSQEVADRSFADHDDDDRRSDRRSARYQQNQNVRYQQNINVNLNLDGRRGSRRGPSPSSSSRRRGSVSMGLGQFVIDVVELPPAPRRQRSRPPVVPFPPSLDNGGGGYSRSRGQPSSWSSPASQESTRRRDSVSRTASPSVVRLPGRRSSGRRH